MKTYRITILVIVSALLFLGAACAKKTSNTNVNTSNTNTTINTNVSSTTNTNVSNTNAATNTSNDNATPLSATVTMTSAGFSPSVVTVRAGGTVTWRNDDTAAHQPASDPHPAHTNVPGFDALRGLDTGEPYAFTFTRAGTFTYHDHLNPTVRGTVIVK